MLNYRLKFKKIPRLLKKDKRLKTGIEYTLPQVDKLYQLVTESLDGELEKLTKESIKFEILSMNDNEAIEFNLPAYNLEAPLLQDAIAFDFSKEKMKLEDDPQYKEDLKRIVDMEESIMSEFNTLISEDDNRQTDDSSEDEKESMEDAEFIKKQQEEQEYLESLSSPQTIDESEDFAKDDELLPEETIDENFIDQTMNQEEDEVVEEVQTRQSRCQHHHEEVLIEKQHFVLIENEEVQSKINELERAYKTQKEEGVSLILSKLAFNPSDNDFIRDAKIKFIKEHYSDDILTLREQTNQKRINDLFSDSNDILNEFYDKEINKGYKETLENDHQTLIHHIKKEYDVKKPTISQEKEQQYRLSLESMESRHSQEKEQLNQKQIAEKQALKSTYQSQLQDECQSLEKTLNERYETEWENIQITDKNEWIKLTNNNLIVGKQNVINQLLDKLNQIYIDNNQFIQQFIGDWQRKVDDNQESFELAYQKQKESEKQELQLKELEAKRDREERELALEENKVALQKNELNQEIKEINYEKERLEQEVIDLKEQINKVQVEARQRENELMKTISEGNHQLGTFMNREKDHSDVYSKKQVKTWMIGGVASALLAMGLVGFGVKSHYDHVSEMEAQEQLQKAQSDKQKELENVLKQNEEDLDTIKEENKKLSDENKKNEKALEEANKKLEDAKKDKKSSKGKEK